MPDRVTPRSGGIGIGLVQAGGSTDSTLGRLYVVDRLAPGNSLQRRVELINTSNTSADVVVYAAAARMAGGRFAFAAGQTQNDLSRWTSVSRKVVRLGPGGSAFDTLTIDVPRNPSRGAHYAVVWAEVSTMSAAEGGVRLVNRTGLRLYISVGPAGGPGSNFSIVSLVAKRTGTGQPVVVAEVHNTDVRSGAVEGRPEAIAGAAEVMANCGRVETRYAAEDHVEAAAEDVVT